MTARRNRSETTRGEPTKDVEKLHPLAVDGLGAEISSEPLPVRLSGVWSDFLRLAVEPDRGVAPRKRSVVPILDDMKGILQWD